MSKFDIIIKFGFDIYQYYKHNNYNIEATKKHFIPIIKKELYTLLELYLKQFEDIHKDHIQFKKYLDELKINYIILKVKDFKNISIQDGIFRYIPLIEINDIKLINHLYSLSNKDPLSSISDLFSLFNASLSCFNNGLQMIGLNTAKPMLRKILINKKIDFNECSICLEILPTELGNVKKMNGCDKCCNVMCDKCCKSFKDCPVCRHPFSVIG